MRIAHHGRNYLLSQNIPGVAPIFKQVDSFLICYNLFEQITQLFPRKLCLGSTIIKMELLLIQKQVLHGSKKTPDK